MYKNKKKNPGKIFEEDFIKSVPSHIFTYRLRDSVGAWASTDKKVRFTSNNICDYIIHNCNSHKTMLFELKSTNQKSIPFGNIRDYQINEMAKASKYLGDSAYFIINFRKLNQTYALKAEQVRDYISNSKRKSIPVDFCQKKGIEIRQMLKRIRYKYDIDDFLMKV